MTPELNYTTIGIMSFCPLVARGQIYAHVTHVTTTNQVYLLVSAQPKVTREKYDDAEDDGHSFESQSGKT